MTRVLGLAFSGHGTSACLLEDGRVARAVNLERLTRRKFSISCLSNQKEMLSKGLANSIRDYSEPFDAIEVYPMLLEYLTGSRTTKEAAIDLVVKTPDLVRPSEADDEYERFLSMFDGARVIDDLEHHKCHAYQAFLSSPFEEAAVLTIDGMGDALDRLGNKRISSSLGVGSGTSVTILDEITLPTSVGGMYATCTLHLGFGAEQEGNTMALAAFGDDSYWKLMSEVYELKEGGRYRFHSVPDRRMRLWKSQMEGHCRPRDSGAPMEQSHKNLAYGAQRLAEECVVHSARELATRTGLKRLAIAGGVGLNCVMNWRVLSETPVEELYVMPNAGDRGLSVGAALYGHHVTLGHAERKPPQNDYLGRPITVPEIHSSLSAYAGEIETHESNAVESEVAEMIAGGLIVGWVQGGAEFGPRALGHRSILGDPRTKKTKERLDSEIKRRESFRPYAPSVMAEHADEYFEMLGASPYMLQAVNVRPERRASIEGVVHVDGSARVQTVDAAQEPRFHRLISEFYRLTGVPVLLNTSFNGYGEAIAETPSDAMAAFMDMGLDALVLGDTIVRRRGASRE